MDKFSIVPDELLPVQSLKQFMIDIGVKGVVAIQTDDGVRQKVAIQQLDTRVLSGPIKFCTTRDASLPGVWSVVPIYVEGERFTVKAARWNPSIGEVDLTLSSAKTASMDVSWTIPMCRYKIGGGVAGLRPCMSAWWVPRPKTDL